MRAGRVSRAVYRRSVLKQLHTGDGQSLLSPSEEEMCYGTICPEECHVLSCQEMLWGNEPDLGVYALARGANALATRGALPVGTAVSMLLPEEAEEAFLKERMKRLSEAAKGQNIALLEAKAGSAPVGLPVVSVTVSGTVPAGKIRDMGKVPPGEDILLLKWTGLEGMLRIRFQKARELEAYFPSAFLELIDSRREEIFSLTEIQTAVALGASAVHPVGEGGIFAALWNLAEGEHTGFRVDLKKIALRQETIEVCELFHLNPYQAAGTGCALVVCPDGEKMADALKQKGVYATVIGHTEKGKQKILENGQEIRYLDRPAPDETTKLYQM